ncbi:MAG: hypothetical protein GYA55_01265 [SAR324 cluster bacterium]|uniref:Uncharacterized protein n=1 Tax=SAR324 cluster bacterium TaxID=2024889 RepID=A0A7X9FP99_9DELT|nr:hypothetical protein [SAR324 cluster bacterium]
MTHRILKMVFLLVIFATQLGFSSNAHARMRRVYNPYEVSNPFGVRRNAFSNNRMYGTFYQPIRRFRELGDSAVSIGRNLLANVTSGRDLAPSKKQNTHSSRHWSQSLD